MLTQEQTRRLRNGGMNPDPLYVAEPTRDERRERRVYNGRKMNVVGRSVFLLATLTGVARRRKVARRTRKGNRK